MVNVSVRTSRRAGVTFAHVVVENPSGERQRVRLAVACEAAVWPPRRRGVPEAGWDADGVTVTVAAGGVRGVGFATPANAVTVEHVATTGRGDGSARDRAVDAGAPSPAPSEAGEGVEEASRVDGVVRALGSFAPPLAATPREERERAIEHSSHGTENSSPGTDSVGGRGA